MNNAKQNHGKSRRLRYPGVSLPEAIDKARVLYTADGTAGTSREAFYEHLGYSGRHGTSLTMLTSLEKFQLTYEENGRIFPTNDGVLIHLKGGDPVKREEAIQRCALKPELYKYFWDSYAKTGSLPSDATLRTELVSELKFNPKKVDSIIRDYRVTLHFAGLRPGVSTEQHYEDKISKDKSMLDIELHDTKGLVRDFAIPRRGQKIAMLRLEYPVTEEDVDHITTWLELMKDTISEKPEVNEEEGPSESIRESP